MNTPQPPHIPQRGASLGDPVLRTRASFYSGLTDQSDESLTASLKELNKRDGLARRSQMSIDASTQQIDWFRVLEERVHLQLERVEINFARKEKRWIAGAMTHEEFEDHKDTYLSEVSKLNSQITNILDGTVRRSAEPKYNKEFVSLLESQVFDKIKRPFKDKLIKAYGASNPNPTGVDKECWCPVSKRYAATSARKGAHLFPHKLGQEAMNLIFGEAPNETYLLNGAKNGLLLDHQIEEQFDYFNLVIVPLDKGEGRWVIRILDHALLPQKVSGRWDQVTFKELDGEELEFKNDFRPGARFLYLHYVLALLRATQPDRARNQKGVIRELHKDMPVWASPGRYLTENMLLSVAEKAGQDISKFAKFSSHSTGTVPNQPNLSMGELREIIEDEELYDTVE